MGEFSSEVLLDIDCCGTGLSAYVSSLLPKMFALRSIGDSALHKNDPRAIVHLARAERDFFPEFRACGGLKLW
jgi:hypothetical protein